MTDITLAPETLAARIPALLRMPVYFNGLVMENTNRCNSKCAICYQSAGGNTPAERLNVEKAVSVIEQAAILENIGNRFHLAGGEEKRRLGGQLFRGGQHDRGHGGRGAAPGHIRRCGP